MSCELLSSLFICLCVHIRLIFSHFYHLQNLWVGTKQCRNGVCEVFNTNSSFLHALAKTMATMFLIFLTSNNLSKFKVPVFVIWYKWYCEVIYTNSSFHIDQGKKHAKVLVDWKIKIFSETTTLNDLLVTCSSNNVCEVPYKDSLLFQSNSCFCKLKMFCNCVWMIYVSSSTKIPPYIRIIILFTSITARSIKLAAILAIISVSALSAVILCLLIYNTH